MSSTLHAGSGRPRWGLPSPDPRVWLVVLLFLASLPAVTTRLYSGDEIQYFAFLRSLWFDRDLSFENEYRYFYDRGIATGFGFHRTFLELTTPTGVRLSFATIGCAILWLPFYAAAHLAVTIARLLGSGVPADGFSWPYLAAVTFGSAVYGALAVLVSAQVARRVVGNGLSASLWVAAATPLVFYMYVAPGMAHACSAFVAAVLVAVWLRVRDRWSFGGLAVLAGLAALTAMVREQDAFLAIGPAVDYAVAMLAAARWRQWSVLTRMVWRALAVVPVFCLVYLPQAMAYIALNGRLGPASQVSRKMTWSSPHALEVLLSFEHGFFVWTPVALVGIAGLVHLALRGARGDGDCDSRRIGALALLMVGTQVYVNGAVESWTLAGAFGQRRFVAITVFLVLGIAQWQALAAATWPRRWLRVTLAVCLWWNVGLMVQFGAGMMDRQRLEPARNAYNTFVRVPARLPELAYRYAFDRRSFYRPSDREPAR